MKTTTIEIMEMIGIIIMDKNKMKKKIKITDPMIMKEMTMIETKKTTITTMKENIMKRIKIMKETKKTVDNK